MGQELWGWSVSGAVDQMTSSALNLRAHSHVTKTRVLLSDLETVQESPN